MQEKTFSVSHHWLLVTKTLLEARLSNMRDEELGVWVPKDVLLRQPLGELRFSGLSGISSVSHFQSTFCFRLPKALTKAFLMSSDISLELKIDPKESQK